MNAVEHIVECYFRLCEGCFTIADVKILRGNNRQCDLLAYNIVKSEQYHAESSVIHEKKWCPTTKKLNEIFNKKFLGFPRENERPNSDFTKGKNFYQQIENTYKYYGLNPQKIRRIFITWYKDEQTNYKEFLADYEKQYGINVDIWDLRDTIIPKLEEKVSTSNYDDEVLRTMSLLKQRKLQANE